VKFVLLVAKIPQVEVHPIVVRPAAVHPPASHPTHRVRMAIGNHLLEIRIPIEKKNLDAAGLPAILLSIDLRKAISLKPHHPNPP